MFAGWMRIPRDVLAGGRRTDGCGKVPKELYEKRGCKVWINVGSQDLCRKHDVDSDCLRRCDNCKIQLVILHMKGKRSE